MDKDKLKNRDHGRLSKHIEVKSDNWSVASKNKLSASVKHKMKRIYTGILDALDKELSDGNIDEEMFDGLRSKVLNIGNDQIRNMELELQHYNVEFVNYHVEFKVLPE